MIYFIVPMFLILFFALALLFALPYWVYILVGVILGISGRYFIGIILIILGIAKYRSMKRMKDFRDRMGDGENFQYFYYGNGFNQEDFNNYNQGGYYQPQTEPYEYERACEVLGVSPDVSYEEKRKAYRNLLKKYHPDLNPSKEAEEMSKKVNDAWDIIEKHDKG